MAKIILQRKKSFVGCLRSFKVMVDGKKVAMIKNGQQLVLDLVEGEHELFVKYDWSSSNKLHFTIAGGEEYFLCEPGVLRPKLIFTNDLEIKKLQADEGGLDMTIEYNWQTLVVFLLLLAVLAVAGARGYAYLQLDRIKTVDHLAFDGEQVCVHQNGILYFLTPDGWLQDSVALINLGIDASPEDLEFAGKNQFLIGHGKTISLCNPDTFFCEPVDLESGISSWDNYKFTYDKNHNVLFVANTNDHAVLVRDMGGDESFTMSGVELSYPNDMTLTAEGTLLIADTKNSRITELELDVTGQKFVGQHDLISMKEFPEPETNFAGMESLTEKVAVGAISNSPSPLSLAGDEDGNWWVIVADAYINYGEIWKFAEDGTLIEKIRLGENAIPLDIIEVGRRLLVSESETNQVYSIDPLSGRIDIFGDTRFQEILDETRETRDLYRQIKNNSFMVLGILLVGMLIMLFVHKQSRARKNQPEK